MPIFYLAFSLKVLEWFDYVDFSGSHLILEKGEKDK